ncbi:MAG: aldehyde ferredoxin oxidoreductase N-terminal domain-containing protein, partial [Desulfobacterales bacterium]
MHYGSAGKNLEINLSTGKSLKTEVDTTARGMYLGGRGTNTKLFWDRVPPETDPYSADNLMVFGVGILTGTLAPGANRTILTTLSPQTNLQTYSSLGGFWGAELKHAGYDNLIVSGKSSKPAYLWINGDKAEIRDASHLWGKDVRETSKIIRDELKQNRAQVLSIGQAGENRVLAATIEHGSGTGASRAGVGAVMGDKKLKAIAVYGTNDIHIARPADFYELCEHILKKTDGIRAYFDRMSYECHEWFMNNWAWGNLGPKRPFDNAGEYHENFVKEFSSRTLGCFNCTLACKVNIKLPEGEYCSVKCQSWFAFMFAVKTRDLLFNARCVNLCEKFGLDTVSTACNIAFAIDLFEKGILTKADTQGEDLEWENQDLVLALIGKIARREGIGDILADGVYEAARQIGRSALKHAYHIKKLEMIAFQPTIPYCALRTAVTDRLDMTRAGSSAVSAMENTPKWKQEYVKTGYFHYPKEFEKPFVEAYVGLGRDYEKMVPFTSRAVDTIAIA